MSTAWLIAAIPGTLAFLAVILALSAVAEERFLSPRSLILAVVRARRSTPEYAEAYVARQFEKLLADQPGRPARPQLLDPQLLGRDGAEGDQDDEEKQLLHSL